VRIMQAATSLGKIKDIRTGQVMKDAWLPVLQHLVEKLRLSQRV
jgi:hypothetical protein